MPGMVCAQVPTGVITVFITDTTGARMRLASVVVTCKETDLKRTVLTPDAGEYIAPVLAPGLYEVTADAAWEPCKQHTSPKRRMVGAQCPNME